MGLQRRVGVLPGRVGGQRRGSELGPVDERRRDQHRLDHQADARRVALHRALGVDVHQVADLGRVEGAPKRFLRERLDEGLRAGRLRRRGRAAARGDGAGRCRRSSWRSPATPSSESRRRARTGTPASCPASCRRRTRTRSGLRCPGRRAATTAPADHGRNCSIAPPTGARAGAGSAAAACIASHHPRRPRCPARRRERYRPSPTRAPSRHRRRRPLPSLRPPPLPELRCCPYTPAPRPAGRTEASAACKGGPVSLKNSATFLSSRAVRARRVLLSRRSRPPRRR